MKRQRISDGWMRSVNKGAERRVDLPDDFVCPVCGAGKDAFSEAE